MMEIDIDRQRLLRDLAAHVRASLKPRGVYLIVDWGDGEVGSWLNAGDNSVLHELVDATEGAALDAGVLISDGTDE